MLRLIAHSFGRAQLITRLIAPLSMLLFMTPCVAAEFTPRINGAAIRAHAEFLASDLLEGRATGSRGYELAAAYVAAQFRQYGLSPAGEGDSYLQAVPLIEATVVLPGSSAILKREAVNDSFEFASDYLPAANFFSSPANITAQLAFAGFGITAPELNYDDLAAVDVQGRIAVILEGAPKRFNAASRNYYAWRDTKYANLIRHGAVAVIEVMTGEYKTDSTKSDVAWERAVAMSWVSDMRRVDANDEPAEPFPELRLRFRFKAEAAARLFSNGHSFEQVLLSAAAGEPQGFSLPGTMTLTATTGLRRIASHNVIGVIPGSDPELRHEYVLVTANLDHLGRGAAINGDSIYNGLQHNATGVAMMLELARALATLPTKPKRSIIFAAVTAGEKSAQGIQHLLAASSINANSIVAAVSLNTPLPLARTTDVIALGADQSSLGSNLAAAAQPLNMRLTVADAEEGSLLNLELAPLVQAEIPSVAIRSGNRARASRVDMRGLKRDYLQLHLDQPSDDSTASSLDLDAATDLDVLTANLTTLVANAAQRPMWYRSSLLHNKLRR
jgi:hypothetical protein